MQRGKDDVYLGDIMLEESEIDPLNVDRGFISWSLGGRRFAGIVMDLGEIQHTVHFSPPILPDPLNSYTTLFFGQDSYI